MGQALGPPLERQSGASASWQVESESEDGSEASDGFNGQVLQLFLEVQQLPGPHDAATYERLIDACCNSTMTEPELLHFLVANGVEPNVFTYKVLIIACDKLTHFAAAGTLLADMIACGHTVPPSIFRAAVHAHDQGLGPSGTLAFLAQCMAGGLVPDDKMVAGLTRAWQGQHHDAVQALQALLSSGPSRGAVI